MKGYSLNELVQVIKIPKTTVHDWVSHETILSRKAQKRIRQRCLNGVLTANRNRRKKIIKPLKWSTELVSILGHFLFDGYPEIKKRGYVYCSRNLSQIRRIKKLMLKNFGLSPHYRITNKKIIRVEYNSVELYEFINKKIKKLLSYILKSPKEHKRSFLRAFFDDEGGIYYYRGEKRASRTVKGFQYSLKILKLIENLLQTFGINSCVKRDRNEIVIRGRENLIRFQKEINFSAGIYINHQRKRSYWKYRIDKRTILKRAIQSYLN
ncbi:MAG: hypothetical protein NT039_01025 [Candidatus Berkelbacteria bacterium]|nr:hypothetical protein [Candidatus Berkelbacteria bacterium]